MENLINQNISISAVSYSENFREDWNQFVERDAINSTFLHSRVFFDHNVLNANDDASLLFYKGEKVIAVLPAVVYMQNCKKILHSHLRATYGGFVISKKVGIEEAIDIVGQTLLFAKRKNVDQVIVRNPFRIFSSEICDETDYAMWYLGFQIKSRELEIAIRLCDDVSKSKLQYHNDVSRNVKKAHKNVEIASLDNLSEFWILLESCLWQRHRKKPVHDVDSIMKLISFVGREKVLTFGAFHNQTLIGG